MCVDRPAGTRSSAACRPGLTLAGSGLAAHFSSAFRHACKVGLPGLCEVARAGYSVAPREFTSAAWPDEAGGRVSVPGAQPDAGTRAAVPVEHQIELVEPLGAQP
jgi:hypothetical protein